MASSIRTSASLVRVHRFVGSSVPHHSLLAQALVRLDRAPEALPLAQRAVTLAPFDSFSHSALARVYWAMSRRDDAIGSAQRAISHADDEAARKSAQQLLDFYSRTTR